VPVNTDWRVFVRLWLEVSAVVLLDGFVGQAQTPDALVHTIKAAPGFHRAATFLDSDDEQCAQERSW
jgi:hypothetical protein